MKTQFFTNTQTYPTISGAEKSPDIVTLRENEIMRLKHQSKQLRIKCLSGIAWITQPNDEDDYILYGNDFIDITKKGLVLVQAMPEAKISVWKNKRA